MKIIIVPKISKYEYDMNKFNINEAALKKRYLNLQVNMANVLDAHTAHYRGLDILRKALPEAEIIHRNSINKSVLSDASIVMAYGGDDHFKYVSHFLDDIPIMGVTSDNFSLGFLNSFSIDNLDNIMLAIDKSYKIEKWTRIKSTINGVQFPSLAISEIYIGELKRADFSRILATHNSITEKLGGSGLIVSTGAGSTGWYDSTYKESHSGNEDLFDRQAHELHYIWTESFTRKIQRNYLLRQGIIHGDDLFEAYSLNDSQGVLSIDSIDEILLNEGDKIKIEIGNPLNVVSKNNYSKI